MVDVGEEAPEVPPTARRPAVGLRGGEPPRGRHDGRRRRPGGGRIAAAGPFFLVLAAVAPLAGALYQIVDLFGTDGLTSTTAVGPRVKILGDAVNLVTALLLVVAVVVAALLQAAPARLLAGVALVLSVLFFAVSVAVGVVAAVDESVIPRAGSVHVSIISYEVASALVALAAAWVSAGVLRRPVEA